jgi:hypothetical protein
VTASHRRRRQRSYSRISWTLSLHSPLQSQFQRELIAVEIYISLKTI